MTIAHDSEILGAAHTASGGNYDTSITPAAAPNGVCVIIVNDTAVTDAVVSVTYGITTGAVPLTRRRFNTEPTEPGGVDIWWAGGVTFPAGAQTVRIAKLTGNANNIRAAISTMTCAVGQQVAVDADNSALSAAAANPTVALTTTVADTVCYMGLHSGINALTSAPATNWTAAPTPGFEDVGNFGRAWGRRTATATGNQAPGWTIASDDYVISAIAFKEVPLTAPPGKKWQGLPSGTRRSAATVQAANW
jgi:hypothetical protein